MDTENTNGIFISIEMIGAHIKTQADIQSELVSLLLFQTVSHGSAVLSHSSKFYPLCQWDVLLACRVINVQLLPPSFGCFEKSLLTFVDCHCLKCSVTFCSEFIDKKKESKHAFNLQRVHSNATQAVSTCLLDISSALLLDLIHGEKPKKHSL